MSLLSRLAVQAARAYGILSSADKTKVVADYLVVAGGGGGGGSTTGGGGGAGGYRTSTATLSSLNTYSVTVGAGGNGGANSSSGIGSNGSDSIVSGTGLTTITSTGGGGGGNGNNNSGNSGGSGGGGGGKDPQAGGTNAGGSGNTPSTSPSQGNNGGNGAVAYWYSGGGGGGASAAGGVGTGGAIGAGSGSSVAGNGGNGTSSSISGSSVTYAGGGGGGAFGTAGTGGSGGGGNGTTGTNGANGSTNTGGGGGGAGGSGGTGGTGGSGIVIISYTSATPKFVGGTITTSGGKQIHTFTSSGTLSPITPITASYLVVAGGGSGGTVHAGGGGAGGLLASSTTLYSGATYIVTVGAGGASQTSGDSNGFAGSNSVLSGTGLTTITATGGGLGGNSFPGANGGTGGSGGGGGRAGTGGAGTSGQGNNGGNGGGSGTTGGGGGGGAGAVGSNGGAQDGGAGGAGSASSITGTSTTYAGGGGGGIYTSNTGSPGAGGSGGGGAGGKGATTLYGTPGTQNTGGGGGGGGDRSGAGGSGIVIISYAGSQQFNGGLVTTSGGNTIHTFTSTGALTPLTNNLNNSLRFRSSASAYLNRTPTVAGNRNTWTWSNWIKRGALGAAQDIMSTSSTGTSNTSLAALFFDASGTLTFFQYTSSTVYTNLITTQVFRDPSAWYHIVVAYDDTQATAANRVKIYVNGNQITAFGTATYPTQNYTGFINQAAPHAIGRDNGSPNANYLDGYLADINFIDGQALEPYYFGNNDANGVWKPIQYKGTYGTNGFYLTFGNTTSTTTLGYDSSPNGNNWTCNNISLTAGTTYDAMTDVPTNTSATVANYAVLNPTIANTTNLINANLTRNGAVRTNVASMVCTNGKYYFETTIQDSNGNGGVGVKQTTAYPLEGYDTSKCASYFSNGEYKIESNAQTAGFSTYTNGDVIGIAVDTTQSPAKIWFAKNNTWQGTGDPTTAGYSLTSGLDYYFAILHGSSASSTTASANFGQRPFAYTPPTGYVALNTFNLPTPTILQGNKYMDATTYSAASPTNRVIVNQAQFKPDLVWIKSRTQAYSHYLFDSVRGTGAKALSSNLTSAEGADAGTSISAFNSNGYTISAGDAISDTSAVAWQWQAGQGSTSSNTSGSITSTVSVNTTAGFSIVTYTGNGVANASIGHGLGVTPNFVVVKNRGATSFWRVQAYSTLGAAFLNLNGTQAADSAQYNQVWGSSAPTSSLVYIGGSADVTQTNANGNTYVAYCWASIAGFSRIGSYTGNGSSDGPFIYTGFRPEFIMRKQTTNNGDVGGWIMFDTSRDTFNVATRRLLANSSNAEATPGNNIDILSNGWKERSSDGYSNASGQTYIYMAFAENPFKISNAR